MTGAYAAEHASALADVMAAGSAADFTIGGQGTVDDTTDRVTPAADLTWPGYAIEKKGSLTQYQSLGLVVAMALTLFWVPTTYGDTPALSSRVVWNGTTYSVKNVSSLSPDGATIAATIVVSQ